MMYPVKLGYDEAVKRVADLLRGEHRAEAFVAAVFTAEKTLRRTLRQLIVSAGFTSKLANDFVGRLRGLGAIKDHWRYFEPRERLLTDLVSDQDWSRLKNAAEMRNKLVHGERVYKLTEYESHTHEVLDALGRLKAAFDREYGYSGWSTGSKRLKSALHRDPKVMIK